MNKCALVLVLALCAGDPALSAPMCVSDTLSGYIGLGSAGCEIGGATFSDILTLPPITGAEAVPAAAITITPVLSGSTVGLDIQISASAANGDLLQALIRYTLLGGPFISDRATVSGTSAAGGAFVTDIQNFCAGGTFLPGDVTGCTGTPGALLVFNNGTDHAALAGASQITIVHDFTLDTGSGGTASGGLVSDRFGAVPEPHTFVLVSSALLAVAARLIRQRGRKYRRFE
jgi:hypothetical protein